VSSESPDGQAFEGRLRVLLGTKKYDQLFTEASKYLEGPMAATAYARMAEAKAQTGDKNTAVQYFRKAIEKAGTNEALMVNIIRYMAQVVGIDETMKWCNERLQSQPDSIAVNFAMYNLYRMTGDPNRTIEYLDNCIRIAKDNEQLVLGYRVDKAGILYETYIKTADKTYLKQTIKEYESILQKQPTNVSVLNNIAYMLADTDMDISKALEYAERAYKAASNSSEVLDTYGYVLFKNGKIQQADEILQRALQQYEQNKINAPIDVYEHIGWVKEKLGQDAEALQSYKRAMEVAGKNVSQEVKNRISAEIERMSLKQQ
jgi:tetratricopeptide (TPR) repeat protein